MNKHTHRLLSLLVLASLSSVSTLALQVEEVIVTAQKREQSANDVNVAISAFSGDDLAEIGVVDTRDLSNLIPGFSYADSGHNTPIYSLRGIGFNEKSQTASSTVGVYIDEVALPFPVMTKGANLDLERVEVLKGPQGTLYGRNTTGGAINYIAAKPTETFEAGVSASYGRFETSDIEGFVSGPISDSAAYRLAFRNIHAGEGWQKSLSRTPGTQYQQDITDGNAIEIVSNPVGFNNTLGKKDKQSARLKLVFYPTDKLTINTSIDYWRDQGEPQAPQPLALQVQSPLLNYNQLNPSILAQPLMRGNDSRWADWAVGVSGDQVLGGGNPTAGYINYDEWTLNDTFLMGSLRTDYDLSETHTLTFLGAYADFESDWTMLPTSGLAVTNQDVFQSVNTELYSLELRLSGDNGADMNWVAGIFYSYDHVTEDDEVGVETTSGIFNIGGLDGGTVVTIVENLVDLNVDPNVINYLETFLNQINISQYPVPVVDIFKTIGDQETDIKAVFGNYEWQFTDSFKFTAGARYTEETRDFEGCSQGSLYSTSGVGTHTFFTVLPVLVNDSGGLDITRVQIPPLSPDSCLTIDNDVSQIIAKTLKEDNVSGRIALDWTPNDEMLYYLSYARGFKSGSFPVLSSSFEDQYNPVTQEQLDAFEFGWKNSLLDGLMQFNGAMFFYKYKDKQLLGSKFDVIFGELPRLNNAPESEVKGIEMDIQYSPIDGLYLGLSGSYIKTEIKEYVSTNELGVVDPNDPTELENYAGQSFNYSPEWEVALLANYVLPIGDNYELTFGVDYSYTGDTAAILSGYIDNAPFDPNTDTTDGRAIGFDADGNPVPLDSENFYIDSYSLVNARIAFGTNDDVWKVTLWGRNITNEFYATSIINPGDSLARYTGMPQTYGISFEYNYF